MAEYTEKNEFIISYINIANKTVSIDKYTVGMVDGVVKSRSLPNTCGFVPGDIEKVKEYMGINDSPEINYLNSVWTPEVIAAHEALVAAAQKENI